MNYIELRIRSISSNSNQFLYVCTFICLQGTKSKLQKPPFIQYFSFPSLQMPLGTSYISEDAFPQAENLGPESEE